MPAVLSMEPNARQKTHATTENSWKSQSQWGQQTERKMERQRVRQTERRSEETNVVVGDELCDVSGSVSVSSSCCVRLAVVLDHADPALELRHRLVELPPLQSHVLQLHTASIQLRLGSLQTPRDLTNYNVHGTSISDSQTSTTWSSSLFHECRWRKSIAYISI